MSEHWTDRLSEYLDGHLAPAEAAALEAHLADCPACAQVLDELKGVVRAARSLEDHPPAAELWPSIHERLHQADSDPVVIPMPGPAEPVSHPRWTVRVSVPRLAAAGLALAFASAATAWMVRPDVVALDAPAGGDPALVQVADVPDAGAADTQTDELAELEELLARHRDQLAPNTVRILEKNLAAIDRAIEESLKALATDPGNEFLEGHLERARERKLEYLREASAAFQWST